MRRGGRREELRGKCGHSGRGGGCDLTATTWKEKKNSLIQKREHDDGSLKNNFSQSGRISSGLPLRSLNARNRNIEAFILNM